MTRLDQLAAALFALALLHTFSVTWFARLAQRHPRHAGLLHLLGEVEVVFGFWAFVLIGAMALLEGGAAALAYAESRSYTEPLFVFVVMVVAASRPVRLTVEALVLALARRAPPRWRA
ncbi:MAG: putative Na+/H+ antiporter, partial [Leptothrix sp. (in: b-proteobacteria)]